MSPVYLRLMSDRRFRIGARPPLVPILGAVSTNPSESCSCRRIHAQLLQRHPCVPDSRFQSFFDARFESIQFSWSRLPRPVSRRGFWFDQILADRLAIPTRQVANGLMLRPSRVSRSISSHVFPP